MAREGRKPAAHEDAEETLRTIIRVSQSLFMEYGYRAVSTRQIAEACGLTQPALYHYFADKEALYVEMAREEIARVKVALERITRRSDDLPTRLHRVALYLLTTTQHDLGLMLHDIRYELSPATQATLNELFRNGFMVPVAGLFEEGQQAGLLRAPGEGGTDPVTSAYLFMSMLSRFLPNSRDSRAAAASGSSASRTSDTEDAQLVVRVLLQGLAKADASLDLP